MASWTQPLCAPCWTREEPDREPLRIAEFARETEVCCECGEHTQAGIYVRRDPKTVPFPSEAS